jgi:predicted lipoprotein with Yx(FWY)xxD motif
MNKLLWLVGVAGALTLTACASSGHKGSSTAPAGGSTSQAPVSSASSSESESSAAGAAGPAKVSTATTEKGKVFVGPTGHVLYTYDPDTAKTSACVDQCATAWPPLIGTPAAGKGVEEDELGTITRSDGTTQVTYDGHPLYYFGKDEDAEDVYGDGVAGVWHVAKADSSGTTSSSGGGKGY